MGNINIISIRNFSTLHASCIKVYMNRSLKWNTGYLFVEFNRLFSRFHAVIIKSLENDSAVLFKWESTIKKLKNRIDDEYECELESELFKGGSMPVRMDSEYMKEIQTQLLELSTIKLEEFSELKSTENNLDIESIVSEIKGEVKKGNKVQFKLIEELKVTIEELSMNASSTAKESIKDSLIEFEQKTNKFMNLAISSLDSMDLIYQSVLSTDMKEWAPQIEGIIKEFLVVLDSFGIEEIIAENTFFNGETMISIGTVPNTKAPELERYQVYLVKQRGFQFKDSGKLIREATVITIY
ncbi:nucleotide exchange factor GrpE [Psychrobacillus sp. NPDC093180]|uniref:nucleotide exchange factor GrpE n=1 Tax=Psychrobacillus sp. NPDC093180 TaxID=3364489 RepID=UPI0038050607